MLPPDDKTRRKQPEPPAEDTVKEELRPMSSQPRDIMPLPPQGPGRPQFTMNHSSSAPDLGSTLRKEYLGVQGPDQIQIHGDHGDYRTGLHGLLRSLESQTAKRKAEIIKRDETEHAKNEMRRAHQLFLEGTRMSKQKPDFTYCDAPGFFENPQLKTELGGSGVHSRNKLLSGIYDVDDPNFKPPHSECNVHGGWTYFQTNLRNEQLYEFRDKAWQKTPMSPKETMYQERLAQTVERMTQETKQDALNSTTGSVKKQRLWESLGEHSCLKRGKRPWVDQAVSTHTTFHDYDAYKPGDHWYETALDQFIVQPERRMNHQRQIIVGDETKKSFWKCPQHTLSGTNRRQAKAQEVSFYNMRGTYPTGARPPSPSQKRKLMLRGTGSLSFTHFKDALVQPPYERFSPCDRSGPP